jgi:hypothetical protein
MAGMTQKNARQAQPCAEKHQKTAKMSAVDPLTQP